jgi:bifunctional DNA-binding transcriptional regulator/antitoxin component of YhaV-PrlF toxin-antitoxin module
MRRKLQKNKESLFSVIPSEIVEDFGLKQGDKLDFRTEKGYIKVIPVRPSAKIDAQAASDTPI